MENVQQIIKKMNKNNLAPTYLLLGTEQFFIEQFKSKMEGILKDKVNDDMMSIDLLEVSIQDVIMDAETVPFFNEHRLIYVYHPYFLTAKTERTQVKHDLQLLENYLLHAAPFTTMVFIAPYDKLDERKKLTKLFKKQATMVDCKAVQPRELHGFLKQMIAAHHVDLSDEVIALLEAEFANNLYLLEKEIEKLALYAGEGNAVTIQDAHDLLSKSLTGNALQLVDALFKKDMKTAFVIFKNIQKLGEEPIALLALIASQVRQMLQAKILQQKGYPLQQIQSEMKGHPYAIKMAVQRSRLYSVSHLQAMIHLLVETDENIKRGLMEQNIAFEMLLYRMVHIHN